MCRVRGAVAAVATATTITTTSVRCIGIAAAAADVYGSNRCGSLFQLREKCLVVLFFVSVPQQLEKGGRGNHSLIAIPTLVPVATSAAAGAV
ncbi:hypothetical protein DOY81_012322 [Sarcophaga bullata]|nr:hypothetical protein DOY81_012322 [Sarcophaga bullata]